MAQQIKFIKASTLPGTLDPNSFYFIENGTYAESYLTNSAGVARMIGNTAMITAISSQLVTAATSIHVVANIAERDSLTLSFNAMVLVLNAVGDPTVASGAATYFYRHSNTSYTKIAEYESMDVVVQWASINGKPSSAVVDIDDAVTKRHSHTNKAQLDKIGQDAEGHLTYDGEAVSAHWNTNNW